LRGASSRGFKVASKWRSWLMAIDGYCGKQEPNTTLGAGLPKAGEMDLLEPGDGQEKRLQCGSASITKCATLFGATHCSGPTPIPPARRQL
jgi:hypothetical protein